MNTNYRHNQIQKFVGSYADTKDFVFQQKIRKMDLAIKQLLTYELGAEKAEKIFINGWGIVLGAAYILEKKGPQFEISELYRKTLTKAISDAVNTDPEQPNPFVHSNIWALRMPILTHRSEGEAPLFKEIDIPKTIDDLNRILPEQKLRFELYADCRIYLMFDSNGEKGFFDKLWETDFSAQLKERGFEGMERNCECPHATLVDSPTMSTIKKKCQNEEQYRSFFLKLVEDLNSRLQAQEKPIVFTHLTTKYCENYPIFEEIVIAKIESHFIESSLNYILEEVQKEFNTQIRVADKSNYHVTVAIRPRQPKSIPENFTLKNLTDSTGDFSKKFNQFLFSSNQ